MSDSTDYWMRYRKADLVAQIAAEEALGRNTGLLHAAKRMVAHLEGQTNMQDYPKPEPITIKSYESKDCGCVPVFPVGTTMAAPCPDCLMPHPAHLCPKKLEKITADQGNDLGKGRNTSERNAGNDVVELNLSDWQRLNNEVTRLTGAVADLTGRMGAREDAARSLVEALDDVNKNLNTTDECVNVLSSRVYALEDRLSPPSDESPTDRIAQQDEPHDTWLSNQERIDLIGRWMHPGLWSAMDGRREAILKILGGQHVEPPLAGGGGCR